MLLTSIAVLYLYISKYDDAKKKIDFVDEIMATEESFEFREKVTIFYGTTTGTAKKFAITLEHHLKNRCPNLRVEVVDMKDYSDELLDKEDIALFILSTWEEGKAPPSCALLTDTIEDMAHDFRVSKNHLGKMRYAVFGLGTADYGPLFCKAVRHTYYIHKFSA